MTRTTGKTDTAPAQASQETAPARAAASKVPRAWRNWRALAILIILTLGGLAADLVSKEAVFADLLDQPDIPARVKAIEQSSLRELESDEMLQALRLRRQVAPGVRFTLSTNSGVVFGWPMPRPVVAGATVLTMVLVVGFFATSPVRAYWLHAALALILAGALGNLYDRLLSVVQIPGGGTIRYQVRDFLDCSQIGYRWIFNVADAWLVLGVAILTVQWIAASWREARAKTKKG